MSRALGAADSCDFDVVSVRGVSRHYGRRRALSSVSLECRAGTVTGLFGPNGAGKSTLLAILSSLLAPGAGDVLYGHRSTRAAGEALRARIGVLGHDLFLYGDLSARENLLFFGRMYGLAGQYLHGSVERALTLAGLSSRGDERVAGFSRGMRQRLAVERALLHAPRLVLFDEPFTGLDDASVERLATRILTLKNDGAILVMATHDLDIAEPLIDDAVCLHGGRLLSIPDGGGSLRLRYRRAVEGAG